MLKYRKSSNSPFMLVIALMLTACSSSTRPLPMAIKPPADLSQPCPRLPELTGTSGADVLPWAVGVVHQYNDCRARHRALVEAWPH